MASSTKRMKTQKRWPRSLYGWGVALDGMRHPGMQEPTDVYTKGMVVRDRSHRHEVAEGYTLDDLSERPRRRRRAA